LLVSEALEAVDYARARCLPRRGPGYQDEGRPRARGAPAGGGDLSGPSDGSELRRSASPGCVPLPGRPLIARRSDRWDDCDDGSDRPTTGNRATPAVACP